MSYRNEGSSDDQNGEQDSDWKDRRIYPQMSGSRSDYVHMERRLKPSDSFTLCCTYLEKAEAFDMY